MVTDLQLQLATQAAVTPNGGAQVPYRLLDIPTLGSVLKVHKPWAGFKVMRYKRPGVDALVPELGKTLLVDEYELHKPILNKIAAVYRLDLNEVTIDTPPHPPKLGETVYYIVKSKEGSAMYAQSAMVLGVRVPEKPPTRMLTDLYGREIGEYLGLPIYGVAPIALKEYGDVELTDQQAFLRLLSLAHPYLGDEITLQDTGDQGSGGHTDFKLAGHVGNRLALFKSQYEGSIADDGCIFYTRHTVGFEGTDIQGGFDETLWHMPAADLGYLIAKTFGISKYSYDEFYIDILSSTRIRASMRILRGCYVLQESDEAVFDITRTC